MKHTIIINNEFIEKINWRSSSIWSKHDTTANFRFTASIQVVARFSDEEQAKNYSKKIITLLKEVYENIGGPRCLANKVKKINADDSSYYQCGHVLLYDGLEFLINKNQLTALFIKTVREFISRFQLTASSETYASSSTNTKHTKTINFSDSVSTEKQSQLLANLWMSIYKDLFDQHNVKSDSKTAVDTEPESPRILSAYV